MGKKWGYNYPTYPQPNSFNLICIPTPAVNMSQPTIKSMMSALTNMSPSTSKNMSSDEPVKIESDKPKLSVDRRNVKPEVSDMSCDANGDGLSGAALNTDISDISYLNLNMINDMNDKNDTSVESCEFKYIKNTFVKKSSGILGNQEEPEEFGGSASDSIIEKTTISGSSSNFSIRNSKKLNQTKINTYFGVEIDHSQALLKYNSKGFDNIFNYGEICKCDNCFGPTDTHTNNLSETISNLHDPISNHNVIKIESITAEEDLNKEEFCCYIRRTELLEEDRKRYRDSPVTKSTDD